MPSQTRDKQGRFGRSGATEPLLIRYEQSTLLSPADIAARVQNMQPEPEGSLRAIVGPAPWLCQRGEDPGVPYTYPGDMHGIGHAVLDGGQQELLLIHSGTRILVYRGWSRSFATLIGPVGSGAQVEAPIPDDDRPRIPTQFVPVPGGVVILPQEGRPYFFDGTTVGTLGYAETPGPPRGAGPSSSRSQMISDGTILAAGINDSGYAHDGQYYSETAMHPTFGTGRLGTVERFPGGVYTDPSTAAKRKANDVNAVSGQLLAGQYRAAVQWIDQFGNLSPVSGRSEPIRFAQQQARTIGPPETGAVGAAWEWDGGRLDLVRKQALWTGVNIGPEGTIGRILLRTKDELNSGDALLYEIPPNSADGASAFATINDNEVDLYPDNAADAWLIRDPVYPVPVVGFALGIVWDGRLWAARWVNNVGRLHPSMPGRWGTFLRDEDIYPDAAGQGITGLARHPLGLIVFTEGGVFAVSRADDSGGGYVTRAVHTGVGCSAPGSIATMSDGTIVWLSRGSFYSLDPEGKITRISAQIDGLLRYITSGRQLSAVAHFDPNVNEYRCWLSLDGETRNNVCVIWDGGGWRRRTDVIAAATCITADARGLALVAGIATEDGGLSGTEVTGVWLLDHQIPNWTPYGRHGVIDTAWLTPAGSDSRRTALRVSVWMREYGDNSVTITVYRDWRETADMSIRAGDADNDMLTYPNDNPPPMWGSAVYDDATATGPSGRLSTPNVFRKRRPYWRRASIYIPSCEVFRIQLSGPTAGWMFFGIEITEDQKSGDSRMPP